MLSNILLSRRVYKSDGEWQRWPPDMAGSCEYNEKSLADSRHVVLTVRVAQGQKSHHRRKLPC
jgi:hypothetical protein